MPLIPWRPFWDLGRWFEEEWPEDWFERPRWGLRRWFEEVPMIRTPKMDIYETDKEVVAEVELPGVDPKNISVEVKDNILRVEAKTEEKKEEKDKGYYRKELSRGYYKRAVSLPTAVLEDKVEASYEEGILKVIMPKKEIKPEKKAKKVEVKVKGAKTKIA